MTQQEMQKLNKYLEKPCNKIVCRGKADDDVWHIGTIHYDKHKTFIDVTEPNGNILTYEVYPESVCRCVEQAADGTYIFEGDILKWYCDWDGLDGFSHSCTEQGYVKYNYDKQAFEVVIEDEAWSWDDIGLGGYGTDIWVVGNIYDNYDMIEEFKNLFNNEENHDC